MAISMITKDEPIDRLVLLIDFLRPLWRQFVILDTGSESFEEDAPLLRAAGATVGQIEWRNDFAWARNQTLEQIDSDWVLHLDADEMPSLPMIGFIRDEILPGEKKQLLAVKFFTRNFWGGEWGIEVEQHWHVRMFKRAYGQWYKPLHEQVAIWGQPESDYWFNPWLMNAPKEAYLIHSKPREKLEVSAALYRKMEG